MISDRTILLGFYQGLGDFLSAVPVMNQLAAQNNRVIVAASKQNLKMAELVTLDQARIELLEYRLFSAGELPAVVSFAGKLAGLKPDLVFVSPHAERALSSWKLPLLLWLLGKSGWRKTEIIGARDERLSKLFDRCLALDRRAKLVHREWAMHTEYGTIDPKGQPDLDIFISLGGNDEPEARTDLVIHPGASRLNKTWPAEFWALLIDLLGSETYITMIGTQPELSPLRERLKKYKQVRFLAGSLDAAVRQVAGSPVCLTMDSGFSHVAALLGIKHLAIFGSTDPALYAPANENSETVFDKQLECQPCHLHVCPHEGIPCMREVTPEMVADRLQTMLSAAEAPSGVGDV